MNEHIWKPKDCYQFVMKHARDHLNKEETDTRLYAPFGDAYAHTRRKNAFDQLIKTILEEGGEPLSIEMKKRLLSYVQHTEMKNFLIMCLTIIAIVGGAAWLMFINHQRWGMKEIGWLIAVVAVFCLLYLFHYFIVSRGIRDAIVRACVHTENEATPD